MRQLNHQLTQPVRAGQAETTEEIALESERSGVASVQIADTTVLAESRCLVAKSVGRRRRLPSLVSGRVLGCDSHFEISRDFDFTRFNSILPITFIGAGWESGWNAESGTKPILDKARNAIRPLGWTVKARRLNRRQA